MNAEVKEIQEEILTRVKRGEPVMDILLNIKCLQRLGLTNEWMISNNFIRVVYKTKYNYVHEKTGKFLSSVWFDWVDLFDFEFGKVKLNGKWNYIGRDGEILSPFDWFDSCTCFQGEKAVVKSGDREGFIYRNGMVVFDN